MLKVRCTVRGCGAALPAVPARERPPSDSAGSVLCGPCGHSFDIARSGYVNLLQPQDRRSKAAGDTMEAIAARRRLFDAGVGTALLEALAAMIADLGLPGGARTVDIGSGEGSLLGQLAENLSLQAAGIDLSARAADLAARRYTGVLWLVANADRGFPLADDSVDLVLSITARRNPAESARVLTSGGYLVIAVPAPDDLVQLREAALGSAVRDDRAAQLIAEHAGRFAVVARRQAREQRRFAGALLEDLLVATYRGGRAGRRERVAALDGLEVTLSQEIVVFTAIGGQNRCRVPHAAKRRGKARTRFNHS